MIIDIGTAQQIVDFCNSTQTRQNVENYSFSYYYTFINKTSTIPIIRSFLVPLAFRKMFSNSAR